MIKERSPLVPEFKTLRVARIVHGSYANGPGMRNVLWVQGCTIGCKACFNPHTWDKSKGAPMQTDEVARELIKGLCASPGGLTISGGEPMEQWDILKEVIRLVKELAAPHGILSLQPSVIMFSGWTRDMLCQTVGYGDLSEYVDVVVAGPYDHRDPVDVRAAGLTTSGNQEIVMLTNRLSLHELTAPKDTLEVHCDGDEVTVTGFPSQEVRTALTREFK
jgi:anaerobic ribonucleoside-triphosphate reductase activating protein